MLKCWIQDTSLIMPNISGLQKQVELIANLTTLSFMEVDNNVCCRACDVWCRQTYAFWILLSKCLYSSHTYSEAGFLRTKYHNTHTHPHGIPTQNKSTCLSASTDYIWTHSQKWINCRLDHIINNWSVTMLWSARVVLWIHFTLHLKWKQGDPKTTDSTECKHEAVLWPKYIR